MNNIIGFIQSVVQFRRSMPNADPDQLIQQMMNSGKVTQSQYEHARQQSIEIQRIQKMMSPGAHG